MTLAKEYTYQNQNFHKQWESEAHSRSALLNLSHLRSTVYLYEGAVQTWKMAHQLLRYTTTLSRCRFVLEVPIPTTTESCLVYGNILAGLLFHNKLQKLCICVLMPFVRGSDTDQTYYFNPFSRWHQVATYCKRKSLLAMNLTTSPGNDK